MVKQLPFSDTIPNWVPKKLVTKPKPGFYRMKKSLHWESTTFTIGAVVQEGQIVKAIANTSKWSRATPSLRFSYPPLRRRLTEDWSVAI